MRRLGFCNDGQPIRIDPSCGMRPFNYVIVGPAAVERGAAGSDSLPVVPP